MVSFLAEAEEDVPGGKPRKKSSVDDDEDWVETHSGRGTFAHPRPSSKPGHLLRLANLIHLPSSSANNANHSSIPQDIPDLEPSPPSRHAELPAADMPSMGDLSLQGTSRRSLRLNRLRPLILSLPLSSQTRSLKRFPTWMTSQIWTTRPKASVESEKRKTRRPHSTSLRCLDLYHLRDADTNAFSQAASRCRRLWRAGEPAFHSDLRRHDHVRVCHSLAPASIGPSLNSRTSIL